jgi:molybdenum cofactor cytidylyltransferase
VIAGLVLAAGAGTRFGQPKQLAELDGRPLLEHSIRAMTAARVERVVVVLGAGADQVIAQVDPQGAQFRVCERWDEGQSASLACGLAAVSDCEAAVITLGDQPRMTP